MEQPGNAGDAVQIPLARIGDAAPQFSATSTHGPLELTDYKGSWLIFFSHPADFTPVCTTELVAFSQAQPALRELNCELLGLSLDSVYSHLAWTRSIEATLGVKISFPIIADVDRQIATLYGMIMPGESASHAARCAFVIDPEQRIRAVVHYPLTIGRNVPELVRLVQALQTADAHGVAVPANWHPGDRVVVPAPQTQQEADERLRTDEVECRDWYFCTREL